MDSPTQAGLFYGDTRDQLHVSFSSSKPSKKKRLPKACDECHRCKRRCTGTATCSNCEFAGKKCTYTDASGRSVPPPRVKGQDDRLSNRFDPYNSPTHRFPTPVPTSDQRISTTDPWMVHELVNLFFARCHPLQCFIHRPTFLYDLSRSKVPSPLLLGVLASAAPFSIQFSRSHSPPWQAGQFFAKDAERFIFTGSQSVSIELEFLDHQQIKPSLALAQTSCLLHSHYLAMQDTERATRYLNFAQKILTLLDVRNMDYPVIIRDYAAHVENESMRRLFWYIYFIGSMSSILTSRTLPEPSERLKRLRLPVEEALFDMPTIDSQAEVPRHYISIPVGHSQCRSEFGSMLRVCSIFARVAEAITMREHSIQSWEPGIEQELHPASITELQDELKSWIELLPHHLQLNPPNLESYIAQLSYGYGMASWCFVYIYALAECTVLALHELINMGSGPPRTTTTQEQITVENLLKIAVALDHRSGCSIIAAPILWTLGKHCPKQHPSLLNLSNEYLQMWGVSQEQLMRNEFRVGWLPTIYYDEFLLSTPVGSSRTEELLSRNTGHSVQDEYSNEYGQGSPSSDGLPYQITGTPPPRIEQSTFHQGVPSSITSTVHRAQGVMEGMTTTQQPVQEFDQSRAVRHAPPPLITSNLVDNGNPQYQPRMFGQVSPLGRGTHSSVSSSVQAAGNLETRRSYAGLPTLKSDFQLALVTHDRGPYQLAPNYDTAYEHTHP